MTESIKSTNKILTNKYEDTIHVFFQRLNASFVVALGFLPVKIPQSISTTIKVAYYVGFLARIIGDWATFARIVNYCLLPLWGPRGTTHLAYRMPRVDLEFLDQSELRRALGLV